MANQLVRAAALQAAATTKRGLLERLFATLFEGLVYAQIWEDPAVDMAALALGPGQRLVTIASGGCNVMSYLAADPGAVMAVDLNPTHLALLELKLAAARHLDDHADFRQLFAATGDAGNRARYARLAPHLSPAARAWWDGRDWRGRRRHALLAGNLCRHGLLGRSLQLARLACRLHGRDLGKLARARSLAEQRALYETELAPVLAGRLARLLARSPAAFFGLGIPPAQFEAMRDDAGGDILQTVRRRVERLACAFPVDENWFAHQAFAGRYAAGDGALPPYLRAANHPAVRARAGRVSLHQASVTGLLAALDARSVDACSLLDAQDWMRREQIVALWAQIGRTAREGARVIFRTAAEPSPLPRLLPPELLAGWRYEAERSRALHERDRSAIYGGFHLYVREG